MRLFCTVCSDELHAGMEIMTATRCGHLYHRDCIRARLDRGNTERTCPVCHKFILQEDIIQLRFTDATLTEMVHDEAEALRTTITHLEEDNNRLYKKRDELRTLVERSQDEIVRQRRLISQHEETIKELTVEASSKSGQNTLGKALKQLEKCCLQLALLERLVVHPTPNLMPDGGNQQQPQDFSQPISLATAQQPSGSTERDTALYQAIDSSQETRKLLQKLLNQSSTGKKFEEGMRKSRQFGLFGRVHKK